LLSIIEDRRRGGPSEWRVVNDRDDRERGMETEAQVLEMHPRHAGESYESRLT